MRVPDSAKRLLQFSLDQIEICTYSQPSRAAEAATNLAYYERGTDDGGESLYNRTGVHIERTASYLYAPGEVRYSMSFDVTEGEPWLSRARAASKYLSREYRRADADVLTSLGVLIALIKGCSILKHNWLEDTSLHRGFDPELIHPEFFAVEREDMDRIEDQQAMVHTYYLSKEQLQQIVEGRQDEEEFLKKLKKIGGGANTGQRQNWLHQMVIGAIKPIATGTPSGARAQVSMAPSSQTQFSPEMMMNLMRVDELWVVDDDKNDYTTIQVVEGEILLEGRYRHRNLTGVSGLTPFSKICPDPVSGYFWGQSEARQVRMLQDLITERMEDIRRIQKLQINEPMAFMGFHGLTAAKRAQLMRPKGWIQEATPGAKIEKLGPKTPDNLYAEIEILEQKFDEIGGFKPIMQGQGEPGVRANTHAKTLMRTASPNLRERALRVERNVEASAAITFELMQAKDARVFKGKDEQWLLKQIPEDAYIEVDSHSASPAFIDDARELAVMAKKLGVIDDVDFIRLCHMPNEDNLIAAAEARAKARSALIKQHPELLQGGKSKKAA